MDFLDRVRATIASHEMLSAGEPVLVACSGGADSVGLLHALVALGYSVQAAHFNHQTRAGGSDADEAFVRDLCAALGVPLHVDTADVGAEARTCGESFEVCARRLRYAFLERCAVEIGCAVIATGHHADDQAETVLFRLLRGTGVSGLAGIPPVRLLGDCRVVRPLLDCHRADIESWLKAQGHAWQEDESNADPRFLRNRIRHRLLPLLRAEYNPAIDAALIRLAEQSRLETDFIDHAMEGVREFLEDDAGGIPREAFSALPLPVQRRFVADTLHALGIDADFERIAAGVNFIATAPTGTHFDLDAGRQWYAGRDAVSVVQREQQAPPQDCTLAVPGSDTLLGRTFIARLLPEVPEVSATNCHDRRQVFDADALGDSVILRTRRDGDRIAPLGLGGSKKLKDWFIDAGVPVPARDAWPLLARGSDILWLPGGPVAQSVAITPHTRRAAEVEIVDATE
ncbi:MAG: tRNA lysidine(34) synthetase TilS [Candidatus Hydrogenedens sp.]|nr:tRNA lysidine(34) synthetase TilS [Candidatus Hydrogenedens sp.]